MTATAVARSLAFFALAGLMEIGGGYLVWLWLRESRAVWLGALGGLLLFLYGVSCFGGGGSTAEHQTGSMSLVGFYVWPASR